MKLKSLLCALAALTVVSVVKDTRADELVDYMVVGKGIPEYLSGQPGDPANGRKLAINRKKGNCLACHQMPIPEEQFHGEIGPTLSGVASRMKEAEIRLRLVDPKVTNPDTMMPSFYKVRGFNRVAKKFVGKPILEAQEVEDIVAYLMTLKDG